MGALVVPEEDNTLGLAGDGMGLRLQPSQLPLAAAMMQTVSMVVLLRRADCIGGMTKASRPHLAQT
ncbi:hypothetical protein C41B8_17888 [Salinisphaera hydrothermalis C41B8]|uniref:Uncharacterized protein n=1 Tax=Salinisphaera hydrothermalis (strain C41B8) TaxID=1304275 RepID=A0A084IGN2_SALHC|nr:hypothetical protein C41B8_17888 [Salinisphaera hydrothermalis C41B8]